MKVLLRLTNTIATIDVQGQSYTRSHTSRGIITFRVTKQWSMLWNMELVLHALSIEGVFQEKCHQDSFKRNQLCQMIVLERHDLRTQLLPSRETLIIGGRLCGNTPRFSRHPHVTLLMSMPSTHAVCLLNKHREAVLYSSAHGPMKWMKANSCICRRMAKLISLITW